MCTIILPQFKCTVTREIWANNAGKQGMFDIKFEKAIYFVTAIWLWRSD
jgi:hypothetical protein